MENRIFTQYRKFQIIWLLKLRSVTMRKSFTIRHLSPSSTWQFFLNRSLTSKFRLIYILLLAICILCNAAIAHIFYTHEVKETMAGLTTQTMETISQNVDNSLKTISKTSTYLLGTSEVQNYLQSTTPADNVMHARDLRNSLYLSMEATPLISSILVINEDGTYEGAARYSLPQITLSAPEEAPWYEEVRSQKGSPVFLINGGGYFQPDERGNYISLIRLINSTENAMPLGYLIVNVACTSLLSSTREDKDFYSDICVYNENGPILDFLNPALTEWISAHPPETLSNESDVHIQEERYLLLKFQDPAHDWFYLGAIRYSAFSNRYKPFLLICFLAVLVCILVFLLVALCTNRYITAPLARLMSAMKKTETGDFKHASVTSRKDEIGQLQDAYNEMVDKIQQLLDAKISEQKLLRKAELNTLQEQIKPHFLYNSLSAIAYLITDGQNERAYELIISLSEYYRESLSKGSEIIPLSTEVNIVKNYLKLQKVRFPDTFQDTYEIQEELMDIHVPRLFLQPLVENSLYHGIIPTGDFGTIKVSVSQEGTNIVIKIQDDGIGISEEKLQEILSDSLDSNKKSFGLRGTIERLRIFYDSRDIYQIQSTPDKGTEIILSLPYQQMKSE